ncbi:MAG TPA: right-handed parallel beta-helix repeat-containing protein [Jatrophihabitantaceae bacterium]|nr:right-handed parallel beta-helix repeat-containing protein [Jatrophihabitantaceae bacterium]
MKRNTVRGLALTAALGAGVAVAVVSAGSAQAAGVHPYQSTVYVSTTGVGTSVDTSCATAGFNSIQTAANWVLPGGTVVVCGGTYNGNVTLLKKMTIWGQNGATLNAHGFAYGIGVGASGTTIKGMTVKNADGGGAQGPNDGIVTAAFTSHGPVWADNVMITGNVVTGNAGSGIDLNSTQHSLAQGNVATYNGVGINVADDLGRLALYNTVDNNVTDLNGGGCGIALASHTGAGVAGTRVTNNRSDQNGLQTPTAPDASAGSGVILASPVPNGRVSGNLISGNEFDQNGHGGVVVHAHAPGANFTGNVISANRVKVNNVRSDEQDTQFTGIYIGSASPLTITVKDNNIGPGLGALDAGEADYYGIFTAGPVTLIGDNTFNGTTKDVGSVPTF